MINLEARYERTFGEPWSALEAGVRKRNPDLFELLDAIEAEEKRIAALSWWKRIWL